ncbi:MAG: hypothetical protein OK457_07375 [Thaumarchaeota archaeon]|nr:hypothetical protein [Nitrososphaerota archaeon]
MVAPLKIQRQSGTVSSQAFKVGIHAEYRRLGEKWCKACELIFSKEYRFPTCDVCHRQLRTRASYNYENKKESRERRIQVPGLELEQQRVGAIEDRPIGLPSDVYL